MFCLFSSLLSFWFSVSCVLILYILLAKPGRWLLDLNPTYLRLPFPNVDAKVYQRHKRVVQAKKIRTDKISSPKSLAFDSKHEKFYTGSLDGKLYCCNIVTDEIEEIVHIPEGRLLGMRIHQDILYFIEANTGLYSYNIQTKELENLLTLKETKFLDGRPSKFFDDLVVVQNNDDITIFITDVSRKFSIDMWCYSYLEPDDTGRVLKFNVETGNVATVVDNLCFPNGIEVSEQNQSLLICELAKRRLLQYELKEPNAGKVSILVENLPGEPENVRRSLEKTKETYWLGLAMTRDYNNKLSFLDDYCTEPNVRKLILRSCFLLGTFLYRIGHLFNNEILKTKGQNLKSGLALVLEDFMTNPGLALEIDLQSNIIQCVQLENDGSVVSEIQEIPSNNDTSRICYATSSGGNLRKFILA